MKKNLRLKLTILLYMIFTVSTIVLMYIIYKDLDNPYVIKFAIGYLIFLFTFFFYLITVTIIKMRRLKWIEIRKRLINFILWFVSFKVLDFIGIYFFNLPSKGSLGSIAVPLGVAMGFAFLDLVWMNNKDI